MGRYVALSAGVAIVFAIVAFVLLALMPAPHRPIDYMVAGAVATVVAMFVLFVALISTTLKAPDIFFKRRNK